MPAAAASELRADRSLAAAVQTAALPWSPSPAAGVWRKRLERAGPAEAGRVTSVVRYDAGSSFPRHPHPGGEEILVLDGVFTDERGDHPAGTWMLNPDGFVHAPGSREGCTLFVKLRQAPGPERRAQRVDTRGPAFGPTADPGRSRLTLLGAGAWPERVALEHLARGAALPPCVWEGGVELFVLAGAVRVGEMPCPAGTWVRHPAGARVGWRATRESRVYLKWGHLGG
jgi:hypothetical protein